MKLRNNQKGFSVIEIAIVVAVVGLVAFVGYTAYSRFQDNKATTSQASEQMTATDDTAAVPTIESTADLDEAQKMLDTSERSDTSDSEQLDGELTAF